MLWNEKATTVATIMLNSVLIIFVLIRDVYYFMSQIYPHCRKKQQNPAKYNLSHRTRKNGPP